MKTEKKDSHFVLSELKTFEILAFLKMQVPAKIVFEDKNNIRVNSEFILVERSLVNNKQIIEVDIDTISNQLEYSELLSLLSENMVGVKLLVLIPISIYSEKEELINLISKLKEDIVNSCVYLDYDKKNKIFEVKNKPFINGDSDKLFYFELNDTILGFSEDGPILITDSVNVNSIEDVICN